MIKKIFKNTNMIYMLLFVSFKSYGVNCDEISPNKISQGDEYYVIKPVGSLSKNQIKSIQSLLKKYDRRLSGTSSETYCYESNGRKTVAKDVAKIKSGYLNLQDNGKISLTFNVYNLKDNTNYGDSLEFFGEVTSDSLMQISSNTLLIHTKNRKRNTKGGLYVFERFLSVSPSGRYLNIDSVIYINGFFAKNRTFSLKK